jgi:hypothetical protein
LLVQYLDLHAVLVWNHRRSKSGNYPFIEVYQSSPADLCQFTTAGDIRYGISDDFLYDEPSYGNPQGIAG